MYVVFVEGGFRASHQLKLASGAVEDLHEHDWKVEAAVAADKLDADGFVIDFHQLQNLLGEILSKLDGRRLEEIEEFGGQNATAERVAEYIYHCLRTLLPKHVELQYTEVTEQTNCRARYSLL